MHALGYAVNPRQGFDYLPGTEALPRMARLISASRRLNVCIMSGMSRKAAAVENLDSCDVIIPGYPNWRETMPMAVLTFRAL
jgi:hypothetical protein